MGLKESFSRHYYARTLMELRLMSRINVNEKITFNSVLYLDLIAFIEDCTVSKLASLLQVSKSSVTIKVNELVERGYVTKTRSKTDGRVHYLSISPEAMTPYDDEERQIDIMIGKLKERYSEEELEMFREILDASAEYLDADSVL